MRRLPIPFGRLARRLRPRGFRPFGESGTAAVEFAVFAPLLCLILAGTVDVGFGLHTKFVINGAISAGANYALLGAADVGSAKGEELATRIGSIILGSGPAEEIDATVVVNNGATLTISGGAGSVSGTAANADRCYCPTGGAADFTWGAGLACGASCPGGTTAGKFVLISAERTYTPLFVGYRFIDSDAIAVATVVRTQ